MTGDNITVVRRLLDEAFNEGRLETVDETVASDFVGYDPALPEPIRGIAAEKDVVSGYRHAFPDLHIRIDDVIAEGDKVVTRWTARGTHRGDLWGIEPTGKEATVTGISIDRVEDGRIVEAWTNWDTLGMMQQLGVIPVTATA
jgi:steroid delta-isomerase-like uncharacterized protein